MLVPQHLAPLLALCDGTRDISGLQTGLALRTGVQLSTAQIREFIGGLDEALLLENAAFQQVSAQALKRYREAESRKPSHADLVYPSDPEALSAIIEGYCARASVAGDAPAPTGRLTGVVSPHIDYERGGETYARLWRRCAPLLEDVDLAIIFGTDHAGDLGTITPTRQSYATPLGVLPTDRGIVDGLVETLGHKKAYAEEIHHINEHSIELALVWLHYFIGGRACPIVPVLCGSFGHFVDGEEDVELDEGINATLAFLKNATAGRRTLVIAAADLAHVGPAFGDTTPIDAVGRAALVARDSESLAAICEGDASAFFALSRRESDSRRICGLPPIYIALRLLGQVTGESLGYAQCPADMNGGSLVSIVGALLYEAA